MASRPADLGHEHRKGIAGNCDFRIFFCTKNSFGHSVAAQLLEKEFKHKAAQKKLDKLKQLEAAAKRFDRRGKGRISLDDIYNVFKVQNQVECSKDDLRRLLPDLDQDKEGRVRIQDLFHTPVFSAAVFASMDRNKDGYISKGELKLAQKDLAMDELNEIISEIHDNPDGKLTYEDVKAISKKAMERRQAKKQAQSASRDKKDKKHRSDRHRGEKAARDKSHDDKAKQRSSSEGKDKKRPSK